MKVSSFLAVAIVSLFVVSCASTSKTTRSAYIDGPEIIQKPVVADLDVKDARVTGTATGKSSKGVNTVKQMAIADALSKSGADVLIEPRYEITTTFRTTSVTVTGYPATYKNFRPMEAADTLFIGQNQGGVYKPMLSVGNNLENKGGGSKAGKVAIISGSSLLLAGAAFFGALWFF